MRAIVKKILSPFLKKASAVYFSKPRKYSYKDISVMVVPTVFPPFITISTRLLLEYIDEIDLKNKTFLELGCGCGIISILAAKKGATVTSSDINLAAIKALEENAVRNAVSLEIVYSDLFNQLVGKTFDVIVINPPYYPKSPASIAEKAWFCGADFEYFRQLFAQLPAFITIDNSVHMILSVDCAVERIKKIASENCIVFNLDFSKKVAGEENFIFSLSKI